MFVFNMYMYSILSRTLGELCALHDVLELELERDILMVIIQSKFDETPFLTFQVIFITDTQKHTGWKHNLL